uniref:Uncharacterized protein n=1 Tax=Anopheles albimanus TaxID=7167 RepID=A0A182FDY8_ANOAL
MREDFVRPFSFDSDIEFVASSSEQRSLPATLTATAATMATMSGRRKTITEARTAPRRWQFRVPGIHGMRMRCNTE